MRYAEAAVTITTKLASPGTSIVDFIPLRESHVEDPEITNSRLDFLTFADLFSSPHSNVDAWFWIQAGGCNRARSSETSLHRAVRSRATKNCV